MSIKIMPAIESEKTIIGGLLLEPETIHVLSNKICSSDFYDEELGEIFSAIKKLQDERKSFDIPMVSDELNMPPKILYQLANECISTKNLSSHADIVREKSVQRKLIESAKDVTNQGTSDDMEKDFEDFQFIIQPKLHDESECISTVLLVIHIKSNKSTNILIDEDELQKFGLGYLFGLMQELVFILKIELNPDEH